MASWISQNFIPFVGTVLAASIGWFATKLIADSIVRFFQLRGEIHETIYFTFNFGSETRLSVLEEAIRELRREASRLDALNRTSLPPTPWLLSRFGYDLELAVRGLVALSNDIAKIDGERAFARHDIEKGLRFKLEFSDVEIGKLKEASSRRAPRQ